MSAKRPDLSVRIGDVELSNPVIAASGTFGYGGEFSEIMDLSQLGGIVVKGLSIHVERGNAPPRIVETPGGMLNSIGLQNVGAEGFLEEKLPFLRRFNTAVIANIWGRTFDEYIAVAERLDGAKGLTALELNISCPNIKEGGINFGTDPKQTEQVTRAVREASSLPLWVKLTPGVTDIGELARAVVEIELIGTPVATSIEVQIAVVVDVNKACPGSPEGFIVDSGSLGGVFKFQAS